MRAHFLFPILVCLVLAAGRGEAGAAPALWRQVDTYPGENQPEQPRYYGLFTVRESLLESLLFSLPDHPSEEGILQLPLPGGGYREFRVWETPVMEEELSRKYPEIRTFTAAAQDDGRVTARLDYSPAGFHAMVYDGDNTFFIDPYANRRDGYYRVYYKHDYERPSAIGHMSCDAVRDAAGSLLSGETAALVHGGQKRSYRLALACTGEYAVAVAGPSPTKSAVLARMVVSLNRVIGIYERELAVTMKLVGNTDTLIFLNGASDPYSNNNGGLMMIENQATVNARIGSPGYDIGHVFSTGGGGIAQIASVCNDNQKAKGVTGALNPMGDPFDIDYVVHEMGHQFGADHTFNSNIGGCGGGNRTGFSAFEPGSGSTLMAYAGLCGADNIQSQSSTYFHSWSLTQIARYLITEGTCAFITTEGNQPPAVPSVAAFYHIPYLTPFELIAPPVTGNHDLAYCWESRDRSNTELTWTQTRITGPVFRSFTPEKSVIRVFPAIDKLVQNITSYVGEKLADTSRLLRFGLTVRDYSGGVGSFSISDDSVVLQVIRTSAPFEVTSPDRASVSWQGGNTETVTWNVSETNLPPIGCGRVDIYLSVDGGYSYPFLLKSDVPNTGTAAVVVPNTRSTSAARVKVKGRGNVFFDISNEDFSITHDAQRPYPDGIADEDPFPAQLRLFPVPASGILHVETGSDRQFEARVFNAFGQTVWEGSITRNAAIYVGDWTKGVYYLQITGGDRKLRIARPVLVQ